MSSLPGKLKCSAFEWFSCPEGITPNSGLTGPNNTYIYIYIYIYIVLHHVFLYACLTEESRPRCNVQLFIPHLFGKGDIATRDNFGKLLHQLEPKTKILVRKLERILIKWNRQNVSLSFNQTCLYIYIYIYIYIYARVCVCVGTEKD